MKQTITVVVPWHLPQNRPYLDACLKSIFAQHVPEASIKVVVITDIMGEIKDLDPHVILEQPADVRFFAASVNYVIRKYPADHYLLACDDTILGRDAITEMLAVGNYYKCIVNCISNCDDLIYAYPEFTLPDGSKTKILEEIDHCSQDRLHAIMSYKPTSDLPSVLKVLRNKFTVTLIPHYVVKEIGVFDETYKNSWEDVDYQVRCKMNGISVLTTTKAYIHHWGGKTLDVEKPNSLENEKYFLEKWNGTLFAAVGYL